MKILCKCIPKNIWICYNLDTIVAGDVYIYVNIKRVIYGLKQSDLLAYDNIVDNLASSGYSSIPNTIRMWKHDTKKTEFCLCVDDFGIKYLSDEDVHYLL